MTSRVRALAAAAFIVSSAVIAGVGFGTASGQVLTEKTYYKESFNDYNSSAVTLVEDNNLQNQFLKNTSKWDYLTDGDTNRRYGISYGDGSAHQKTNPPSTEQPFLSSAAHIDDYDTGGVGLGRNLSVPDGMDNPVLVAEHSSWKQRDNRQEATGIYQFNTSDGKVLTTRAWDQNPGAEIDIFSPEFNYTSENFSKIGSITDRRYSWKTALYPVDSSNEKIRIVGTAKGRRGNGHQYQKSFRNLYWADMGSEARSTTINGWESIPEDDSFSGPDPYPLTAVRKPTEDGKETGIRSFGFDITREFTLDKISTKPRKVYFSIDGESYSGSAIQFKINQYGKTVATGEIGGGSSAEKVKQLDLEDDSFTVKISSDGQYDINEITVVGLQETQSGNPLASDLPVELSPQDGYDTVIDGLVEGLNLTTSTLSYIVLIAVAVGFLSFSYTKSVRGQELSRSLVYGAILASVIMLALVPTLNATTWIFTGDTQRAPLANPALEAEPPTYYSTEFQGGTMDGWQNPYGQARPVQSGESFNLNIRGGGDGSNNPPGVIRQKTHISLGNSLSTGFVRMSASAKSSAGYDSNPHQVTMRVRVYVTDGSKPDRVDPWNQQTNKDPANYDSNDLVVAERWARSFDGQVVNEDGTLTFDLEGNTIYTEIIVVDNRNDELARGVLERVAVGATTESGHGA
jgi:hypothetical protein